ncbi:MAG: DnaB-like helicase C-terminal domain-containing protein [Gallionella sp.]|nr:DnaB-like helicase C-terminal domain-containing protein [Gallionella sp.]
MADIYNFERHKVLSHVSSAILEVVEELEAAYNAEPCARPEDRDMYDYFGDVFAPGDLVVLSGNNAVRNVFFLSAMINQSKIYDSCCVLSHDSKLFARILLMQECGVSYNKMCGLEWFDEKDWDRFTDAIELLNSSKLFLGDIPLNVNELDALIKWEIIRGRISSDEVRYQLFVDNLAPLLDAAHLEGRSPSLALSSVLSELKQVAVARRLQVCVAHHAHEANWVEEQSVIARHADAVLTLESRPDRWEFGQEANCTFSMSVNGQVTVEPTSLRIDVPM